MEQVNCRYENVLAKLTKFWWKGLEQSSCEGNEKLNTYLEGCFFSESFYCERKKNMYFYC
jgi:hypothetical protein